MLVLKDTVANRVTKAVSPVITTILDATSVANLDAFELGLLNQDAAQILAAQIERSDSASGPWDVFDDASFSNMDPNGSPVRANVFRILSTRGAEYIRVRGTASGAGLNTLLVFKTYLRRKY